MKLIKLLIILLLSFLKINHLNKIYLNIINSRLNFINVQIIIILFTKSFESSDSSFRAYSSSTEIGNVGHEFEISID